MESAWVQALAACGANVTAVSRDRAKLAAAEQAGASTPARVCRRPRRYGSILRPAWVGEQVAELLGDPRYMQGVAYGFRHDSDILPLDV
jgi:NAD(P)-dependent dehydrogenase (short-subunit alcohol dehydrogenase family)